MKNRTLFVFLILTLLLTACSIQMNTIVQPDGSGSMGVEMGFNAEDKNMLSGLGSEMTDLCTSMQEGSDIPAGASIRQEERGDETWCIITTPFANLDELRSFYEEGDGITVNRLEIVDGKFYYDLSVDMSSGGATTMSPIPLSMVWKVQAPGGVGKNNADEVNGNTLTWNLNASESANLSLESSTSSSGFGDYWWVILICLGCLCGMFFIVVAVVIVILVRKGKLKNYQSKMDGLDSIDL